MTEDPFPLLEDSHMVGSMRSSGHLAIVTMFVFVAGACTAESPAETSTASLDASGTQASPITTAAVEESSQRAIPLVAPARTDPVDGRWFKTNLGLDGLLVIPRDLIWDNEYFYLMQRVAFGDMRVWRSVDGTAWEEIQSIGTFTMQEGGPEALLSAGDRLVAGGRRGEKATIWIYEGSSPWTEVAVGGDAWITGVGLAGPNLVAFGSTVSPGVIPERHARLWVSQDGVSWSEIDDSRFGEFSEAVGIVPFEGGVVAVANRSSTGEDGRMKREVPLLLTSRDGIEWKTLDPNLGEVALLNVSGGERIRLYTRSSVFERADDGLWTKVLIDRSTIADARTFGVGWFDGRIVVMGGTLRNDDHFGEVLHPAAWTYAGDGGWHEFGAITELVEPGYIGSGVAGGNHFVATGNEATDGSPDDGWAVYTFVPGP